MFIIVYYYSNINIKIPLLTAVTDMGDSRTVPVTVYDSIAKGTYPNETID